MESRYRRITREVINTESELRNRYIDVESDSHNALKDLQGVAIRNYNINSLPKLRDAFKFHLEPRRVIELEREMGGEDSE